MNRTTDIIVGIFVFAALCAFGFLAYKTSDFSDTKYYKPYKVHAVFDNIGSLKKRSPVAIGGVKVGEVHKIKLNEDFTAKVTVKIDGKYNKIPTDSTMRVLTAGLLGSNYIGIEPGYADDEDDVLKHNDEIFEAHGAIILENLISQLVFSMNNKDDKSKDDAHTMNEVTAKEESLD